MKQPWPKFIVQQNKFLDIFASWRGQPLAMNPWTTMGFLHQVHDLQNRHVRMRVGEFEDVYFVFSIHG